MSGVSEALTSLKTALEDSPNLSYIKNVFLGERQQIADFPFLMIEPIRNEESDETYPAQKILLTVLIIGFNKVHSSEKQIVGDTTNKGITDIENDVKKALSADRNFLNSAILMSRIKETQYDRADYPVRGFALELEIEIRQNSLTR